jgi:predicted nucleic acid-binding Zn ribbon protein
LIMTEKLGNILLNLENSGSAVVESCRILNLWSEVVDEQVGKNTEAVKIKNQVLYVSTSSSVWAQELSFLKKEIIKKINEKAGKEVVKDVRFKAFGYGR